jgi:hypothetical protein
MTLHTGMRRPHRLTITHTPITRTRPITDRRSISALALALALVDIDMAGFMTVADGTAGAAGITADPKLPAGTR